ncbi:hypothetical protein [Prosthecomicrobium sp. N25]|uniref:hypothetical protein n=1 Tax=Prosthecomicrobium sp. N25 TaxID=3129254 RepID=UPI003078128D
MSAPSEPCRRILSLFLPRLPTDRLIREARGRSWRSGASPDPASPGVPPRTAAPAAGSLVETADAVASGATRLARRIGQATWVPPADAEAPWEPGTPGSPRQRTGAGIVPPIAVVARSGNALRLAAVDEVAAARGLAAGLGLADARARVPDLLVAEADEPGDRALLATIADWCDRWTPLVALDEDPRPGLPPFGLFLEIGASAHLFGGEAALAADLLARLHAQGFAARAAVADTPGAAWAAARFAAPEPPPGRRGAPVAVASGAEGDLLASLPLAALRLSPDTVAGLERVGLKTVGAVMDLPRAPLGRRFGPDLIRRLDQALGREEEPLVPRRPVPALVAERRFAEPILSEADVARTVRSLAAHLAGPLETRAEGARGLELALFRVDGLVTRIAVGTSRPLRDPARILRLFAEKLGRLGDEIDRGYGFETVRLAVTAADRADPAQIDLAGDAEAEADLAALVDRIGARLGTGRVLRALPEATHIPEDAAVLVPAVTAGPAAEAAWTPEPRPDADEAVERPVRLFPRPEPIEAVAAVPEGPPVRFRWRRATYDIARYEGPERIAAEWWLTALPPPAAEPPPPDGPDAPRVEPRRPAPDRTSGELYGLSDAALPPTPSRPDAAAATPPSPGGRPPAGSAFSASTAPARPPDPSGRPPGPASGLRGPPAGDLPGRFLAKTDPRSGPLATPDTPSARSDPPRGRAVPAPAAPGPAPDPDRTLIEPDALPPGTPGLTRDYFRVEDRAGRRFWVFREGLYGRETARPRWFVQGIFA